MHSAATTPGSIEETTTLLEAELPRLEEHQQSLEKELAVVTERLESVRAALSALKALSQAPQMREPAVDAEPEAKPAPSASTEAELVTGPKADSTAQAPRTPDDEPSAAAPAATRRRKSAKTPAGTKRKSATSAAKEPKRRPAAKASQAKSVKAKPTRKTAAAAAPDEQSGGLTEQVVAVLARSGQSPVRARDVAQALGRDASTGSINAVRSTLDRLVATSRAQRAGRGLYQAPAN
ncbi:hypothetical protein GCM10009730_04620 [Streptomyces albidochromogenes]|uniref:hypothetical protein n=1 Tax=Streptomyces albidochromogenes TaxID=329524 RepID=UPI00110FA5B4|nr:hypothetical protein [Streptomyces albidochromogenes]